MRKWLQNLGIVSVIWTIVRAIWDIIGHFGKLQTVWDIGKDWPAILRYSALVLTSVWFPLFLSIVCLVAWSILTRRAKRRESRESDDAQKYSGPSNAPRLPAQIWDETVGLFHEATRLLEQWARSGNPVPPLSETTSWIAGFEAFARNNFSLEQIKIVFDPFEMDFRGGLPSAIKPTTEILDAWQKLRTYEAHLQSFMRDDLRRPPPRPLAPHVSALTSIADRYRQSSITIENPAAKREKRLRSVVVQVRDLVKATETNPVENYDVLGGLIKFSDELGSDEEVKSVCDELEHEFGHPFKKLETESNDALKGEWLQFLRDARVSSSDVRNLNQAFGWAATRWRNSERWKEGRRAVTGIYPEEEKEMSTPLPSPKSTPTPVRASKVLPPTSGTIPSSQSRIFTDKTPHELLAFFKGRTAIQAMEMIEPYLGQWVETEGKILNLYPNNDGVLAVLRTHLEGDVINCPFDHRWREKLGGNNYEIGFTLRIRGKIAGHQNGSQLYLGECELN